MGFSIQLEIITAVKQGGRQICPREIETAERAGWSGGSQFDTNRELMERLDADREAVRQNRKRVEGRREEIKRDMVKTQKRPSAKNIEEANRLLRKTDVYSDKFPEYFIEYYGLCIAVFVNKNKKYLNDDFLESDLRNALLESCGLDEKIFEDGEYSIHFHRDKYNFLLGSDMVPEEWDWRKYDWGSLYRLYSNQSGGRF